ncbi:MAG: hypothetical protein JEZ02_18710 [Desulfatibacillum sp.]|nr:hypothetical protein [Desulfatibacillum sp.]
MEYWWTKPGEPEDQLFRKIMIAIPIASIPGVQVGAGIYSEDLSLEDLNKQVVEWAVSQ